MAARETSFIDSIHRKLKKDAPVVHYVKFALRFVNGWPDAGYFAPNGAILWVEYKVHPNTPTLQQRKTVTHLRSLGQKVAIITLRDGFTEIESGANPRLLTPTPHLWILNELGITKKCHARPNPDGTTQTEQPLIMPPIPSTPFNPP